MGRTASGSSAAPDTAGSTASSLGGAVGSTASAAKGKVASTASAGAGPASSAPEMARRRTDGNPLAAGLIAFGAGWLLSFLLPATAPERQAATQVKDLATEKGHPVAQQLGEAAQQAKEQLREPGWHSPESVKETVSGTASTVASQAHSAAGGRDQPRTAGQRQGHRADQAVRQLGASGTGQLEPLAGLASERTSSAGWPETRPTQRGRNPAYLTVIDPLSVGAGVREDVGATARPGRARLGEAADAEHSCHQPSLNGDSCGENSRRS
jgi:hypothetical protein